MRWKCLSLILAVALVLAGCVQQQAPQPTPTLNTQPQAQTVSLTLKISGLQNSTQVVEVEKGSALFDVLQKNARIEYKAYEGMGALVTAINGVRQDDGGNGKYWQYYADGSLGSVGVSAYTIERPQTIEFRYEGISAALGG